MEDQKINLPKLINRKDEKDLVIKLLFIPIFKNAMSQR